MQLEAAVICKAFEVVAWRAGWENEALPCDIQGGNVTQGQGHLKCL